MEGYSRRLRDWVTIPTWPNLWHASPPNPSPAVSRLPRRWELPGYPGYPRQAPPAGSRRKARHVSKPDWDLVLMQVWGITHWCPFTAMDRVALRPNHLHFIIVMRGASFDCGPREARGPQASSVSMIVGQIKSRATAAAIREGLWCRGPRLWQRSFHDRWLPDLRALRAARRYLELNPSRWQDKYGPGGAGIW